MSTLLVTLAIAFVFIAISIAALAIGWLLTGKSNVQAGACGKAPHRKKDEQCGSGACSLCAHETRNENDKK